MATAQLFDTKIDLPADGRKSLIALLNQQLADTFDLYGQAKQAHWNVKGPQFHQLHVLFDDLAEQLQEYVDLIAERATALGGTDFGTVRMSADASRLDEYPLDPDGSMQYVEALAICCVSASAPRLGWVGGSARFHADRSHHQKEDQRWTIFPVETRSNWPQPQVLWPH